MERPRNQTLAESPDEKELSELMRRAQAGDREAYRSLLARVRPMIEGYVKNSLHRFGQPGLIGSVEDIVQETLLGLHAKRRTYDPSRYFLPWLFAIARYKLIDFLRGARKNRIEVAFEEETEGAEPADALAGEEVSSLLDSLPPKQKEVLRMTKLEGLSVAEVSARTGFSPSDVKTTVHRAIKALQKKGKGSPA